MATSEPLSSNEPDLRAETPWAVVYFALYLASLFVTLENEFLHWITLVFIPFILIYLFQKKRTRSSGIRSSFSMVGLAKSRSMNGIGWAILIGVALSCLQFVLSRNKDAIWNLIVSGKALVLFPLTLLIMLLTAGFTEESFFRGVVQTRLQALFKSKTVAVCVTSLMFGLYHLPYAYLNPQ